MTPIRSQDRPQLDGSQVAQFEADGYLVLRGFLSQPRVAAMRQRALADLEADQGPLEREATVGYPGAPDSEAASGGSTVRRLLGAYDRDPAFTSFVEQPELAVMLRALLGSETVSFVRSHHNCVMTKQPRFSSDTGWHQDVRYWRFTNHNLVNAWLALTPESSPNGSLRVIPGTHRSEFSADRFDDALFLRPDHPENAALIERAVQIELAPGDLLFFHAAVFHFATRNYTQRPKLSAVFTFHGEGTQAVPGTKSESQPEVLLA